MSWRSGIGHQVNQRFLDHQLAACQCAPDATTLQRVVLPSIEDGLAAPTHRYELTSEGRRLAVPLTKTYTRIVNPSLAELDPALPADIADSTPLAKAYRAFERAVDNRIKEAAIAA
jgi:hypothetical protein